MTQHNSAKGKKRRKKPEKLEFVQDFIPIKDLRHGIIETTDGRYIKILEIEPINFMLRSDDEQFSIISTFASWLKISPMKLQFKSITRRADSDKHVAMVREELEAEPSEECKHLGCRSDKSLSTLESKKMQPALFHLPSMRCLR